MFDGDVPLVPRGNGTATPLAATCETMFLAMVSKARNESTSCAAVPDADAEG